MAEVKFVSIDLAIPYGYIAIGQNGFLSDEIFDRKMRIIPLDKQKDITQLVDGNVGVHVMIAKSLFTK